MTISEDYKKGYIAGFKDCQKIISKYIMKSVKDTDILIKNLKYKEQADDNKTTN